MATIDQKCSCGWFGQVPEDSDAWTCPDCSSQYPAEWRGLYFVAVCPKTHEPVGLSERNAKNPRYSCLRCGKRHPTKVSGSSRTRFWYCVLRRGSQCARAPSAGPPVLHDRGRWYWRPAGTSAVIPLVSVQSVEVSGGEVAVSKLGVVLALGVIGGFASKGAKFESAVIVRTEHGETAYYTVDDESPVSVRAQLAPILKRGGVPLIGEETSPAATQTSAPLSVADELAKLASLRNDGVLTEEEFAAQKAKLLTQ